jgi:hypothetical protein
LTLKSELYDYYYTYKNSIGVNVHDDGSITVIDRDGVHCYPVAVWPPMLERISKSLTDCISANAVSKFARDV